MQPQGSNLALSQPSLFILQSSALFHSRKPPFSSAPSPLRGQRSSIRLSLASLLSCQARFDYLRDLEALDQVLENHWLIRTMQPQEVSEKPKNPLKPRNHPRSFLSGTYSKWVWNEALPIPAKVLPPADSI